MNVSASVSGAATPRSKIDALSRDDLIRFVKKQIDKLKTAKCENEKLKVELAEMRKDFTKFEEKLHVEQEKNNEKEEEIQQLNEVVDGDAESNKRSDKSNDSDRTAVCNIQLQNELASVKDLLRKQTEKCDEKKSVENVITLEMADFEKTVDRLQKELKSVNLEKFSLRSDLEATMKEINNIREEKTLLKKKAELALHEKERKDLTEQLQKQVSVQNNEREQLITVIGVNEKKIEDLEALNASLNRQLMSLGSQRGSLQRQFDDLSKEYSTFRMRALYVLEQKKNDDDEYAKGEIEILEETIRQQKKTIDNLTNSHHMLQGELDSSSGHVRTLSAEISDLQRQLNIAIESHKRELSEQRREFELRLLSETNLNNKLLAQIDANSVSHNQEKENLLTTARQEREGLEEEIECLKRALDEEVKRRTEMEKIQIAMTAENVAVQLQKSSTDILPFSTSLNRASKENAVAADKNAKNDDNEEKCEEKSLEEVIYGESEELIITDIWNQSDNSITRQDVIRMITRQVRLLEHARELLNESEAMNARLIEQTKLLKDEIRRMERDRERENHLANTEYLKDIIMKFIAPEKVTDERGHLIPVLTTMLKLNNDEVNLLSQVAEEIL
ncbi:GRIP domain protein [Onchocerca flexuosa]|uniref:GRIP domain protein n=1 Tax=Onchocerca flexuosa TaxID=387005 RepID=A0A238BTC1_9BILA|nr:GRIP domain protein [Onchocerca flexuosa]